MTASRTATEAPASVWRFALCDLRVSLHASDAVLLARTQAVWSALFAIEPAGAEEMSGPRVRVQVTHGPAQLPSDAGEPVFASASFSVFRRDGGYLLASRGSTVEVGKGRLQAALDARLWQRPLQEQRELFLTSMLMALHPLQRYGLHANGLVRDGRGLLIVGDSGAGKTTLTLALMRAGWSYLSDDAIVLRECEGDVEALALRRGISCTSRTRVRFPEVRPMGSRWQELAAGKWLGDVDAASRVARCTPRALVFPQVAEVARSVRRPLGDTEVLAQLLRQSPGIVAGAETAKAQLDVLRNLVRQAPGHALDVGADVFSEERALSRLLEEVVQ